MREIAAREGRLVALLALWIALIRCAEDAIDRWPLQQPVGFLLGRRRRLDILPSDTADRRGRGEVDSRLVIADDSEEILVPHELDRRFGGAFDRRLIDLIDGGAAV